MTSLQEAIVAGASGDELLSQAIPSTYLAAEREGLGIEGPQLRASIGEQRLTLFREFA